MTAVHASEETLEAYVMGTLVGDAADLLERHVGQCDACALALSTEAQLEEKLYALAAATKGVIAIDPTRAAPSLESLVSSASTVATGAPEVRAPAHDVWQMPAPPKQQTRWPLAILAASIACLFMAAAGLAGAYWLVNKPAPQPSAPLAMNTAPPAVNPTPFVSPAPGQLPPVSALPIAPPAPAPYAQVPALQAAAGNDGKTHGSRHGVMVAPGAAAPKEKKSGDLDGLFNDEPSPVAKMTLERSDVASVVRSNVPAFKKCVSAYAPPLPAKLVLKFVIVPSGNTSANEVATPEFRGTSVEPCVLKVLQSMKFPEYQSGTIPVTFPIPIGP